MYLDRFREITSTRLIILTSVFLLVFLNFAFFSNLTNVYPVNLKNGLFLLSLAIVFGAVNVFLLSLVSFRYTIKPVLIAVLLLSSLAGYFMDTYNVIIDDSMIDNVVKTDTHEALDLLSPKLFFYLIVFGILPSVYIYKVKIHFAPIRKVLISHVALLVIPLLVTVSFAFAFSDFYASFIREHKTLRYYANPSFYIYSSARYVGKFFTAEAGPLRQVGLDARIPESDTHRELVVMVVGETARADHFSLNGYKKETNPYLQKEDVVSFTNVWSCGTATASSVPCLFSVYDHSAFSDEKATSTENVLDVLKHAGVNIIWLDNNSDSKGVASRVPYEDYKSPEHNLVCDTECRDEGMLANLQNYIDAHPKGDIFIVLHQMGNHGPAYYKRYPPRFEHFTPVCKTNQLENCTQEEISNAYDNAILYTDYFLSKVIALLKQNQNRFEASMVYISDHGESLGENGLYLHGLPYLVAPDEQKHVPMILWFSDSFDNEEVNIGSLRKKVNHRFTHDNIFHTILGLMEIHTSVYDRDLDIVERGEYE